MEKDKRMQTGLNDIPHIVTMKLIKSLDIDTGWEVLAAVTGFNFEDIIELRQEERKMNGGPSSSLLWKLGLKGYTSQMLLEKLHELNRTRDTEIVATYIMEGDRLNKSHSSAVTGKNTNCLQSYLSRVSISGAHNIRHQQVPIGIPGNFRTTGSEVNFNKTSQVDNSQVKVECFRDKLIPGTGLSPLSHWPVAPPCYTSSQHSFPSSESNNRLQPAEGSYPMSFPTFTGNNYSHDHPTHVMREVGSTSQNNTLVSDVEVAMSVKTAFSYEKLVKATNNFSEENILGEGGFGVVYYGQLHNLDCAVKKFIKQKNEDNKDSTEQIHSELTALLKYQHENIVTLYGYALDGPQLCLVYQYLKNGSLQDRLMRKDNTPPLSWERRLNILLGSCNAISFLHTMGTPPLIHGDIKSANILLDGHLEAKFADLGQSRYATSCSSNTGSLTHITIAQMSSRQFGSKPYQAPEIRSGCTISIKSDIYAMGVVFLEVCSGMQACDYTRHENKFLTDLFSYRIKKLSEPSRVQEFKDRSPKDDISSPTFLSVLKLAGQCIRDTQKNRPSCEKLLEEIKEIYKKEYKEQSLPKSLNSPIEDEVSQTRTLSDYQSHLSEPNVGVELNSCAPLQHAHASHLPMPSFIRDQNQMLQQLSTQKQHHVHPLHNKTNSKIPLENTGAKSVHSNPDSQSTLPAVQSTSERNKMLYHQSSTSSQEQPSSPMSSNKPMTESVLLQKHYDQLSGQLCPLKEILDSNQNLNSSASTPVKNPVEQGEVEEQDQESSSLSSLDSDPTKLAAMRMFDELGFRSINTGSNETVENIEMPLKCDEAKMDFLNRFDESVFRSGRASKSNNNSHGNAFTKKENNNSDDRVTQKAKNDEASHLCNTETPAKEIEASQNRQNFPSLQQNNQVGVDSHKSSSQQNHTDSSKTEDVSHSVPVTVNEPTDKKGSVKDSNCDNGNKKDGIDIVSCEGGIQQQCLSNRENMFMHYNDMIANEDEDGEEDDEVKEEEQEANDVRMLNPFDKCEDGIPDKAVYL